MVAIAAETTVIRLRTAAHPRLRRRRRASPPPPLILLPPFLRLFVRLFADATKAADPVEKFLSESGREAESNVLERNVRVGRFDRRPGEKKRARYRSRVIVRAHPGRPPPRTTKRKKSRKGDEWAKRGDEWTKTDEVELFVGARSRATPSNLVSSVLRDPLDPRSHHPREETRTRTNRIRRGY